MEDNEKSENSLSIGDVFRILISQKWLALILAVLITVVSSVAVYYLGKSRVDYSVTFSMILPGAENTPLTYLYPDRNLFRYNELVSYDNLKSSQDRDEKFKDLNIDRIVENNDISISRDIVTSSVENTAEEVTYTIRVKSTYFRGRDMARDFILELIEMPRNYIENMDINYDVYLTAAETTLIYSDHISYLQQQANFILSKYDSLISSFNDSYVVDNGRILASYKAELEAFTKSRAFSRLQEEALSNRYIKSDKSKSEYEGLLFSKNRELEIEQAVLDSMKTDNGQQTSSVVIDIAKIGEQTRKVEQLKQEIADIEQLKDGTPENTEFNEAIEELQSRVNSFTNEYKNVEKAVYGTSIVCNFYNINVITTEGGTSIVRSVVFGFIIGILSSLIIAYIVGYAKFIKSKSVKEALSHGKGNKSDDAEEENKES